MPCGATSSSFTTYTNPKISEILLGNSRQELSAVRARQEITSVQSRQAISAWHSDKCYHGLAAAALVAGVGMCGGFAGGL